MALPERGWGLALLPAAVPPQSGPTCGLVALSAAAAAAGARATLSEGALVERARALGFSNEGEMFSAAELAALGAAVYGPELEVRCASEWSPSLVCRELLAGRTVLVPYDADYNNEPAVFGGARAHWCLLAGLLLPLEDPQLEGLALRPNPLSDLVLDVPLHDGGPSAPPADLPPLPPPAPDRHPAPPNSQPPRPAAERPGGAGAGGAGPEGGVGDGEGGRRGVRGMIDWWNASSSSSSGSRAPVPRPAPAPPRPAGRPGQREGPSSRPPRSPPGLGCLRGGGAAGGPAGTWARRCCGGCGRRGRPREAHVVALHGRTAHAAVWRLAALHESNASLRAARRDRLEAGRFRIPGDLAALRGHARHRQPADG
eukprot:tig00000142_g8655.t1